MVSCLGNALRIKPANGRLVLGRYLLSSSSDCDLQFVSLDAKGKKDTEPIIRVL